jgi:hypothetical protein
MPLLALAAGDSAPPADTTTPSTTTTTPATTTPPADENASDNGFDVGNLLTVPDSSGKDTGTSIFDSLFKTADADKTDAIDSPIVAGVMRIIDIMLLLIGTFAFVTLFIGGFFMLTSTEENGIERAKTIIANSLIGLVLAFMSYFIVTFVQSFFY